MAKDRNTVAKRQREVEKKRKADQKRERRALKKHSPNDVSDSDPPQPFLSSGERSVLAIFNKYLMTPGKMLCFGTSDLETFNAPLARLTSKGLLVAEKTPGGYSLTRDGCVAMKDGQ